MSNYIDAILHITDLPALAETMAAIDPSAVADGRFNLDTTPATMLGKAALVCVRMTEGQAAQWRGTPGVTILAEAPYGPNAADAIYASLEASPASMALYNAVYPREPVTWADEDGQSHTFTPPFRFGVIG